MSPPYPPTRPYTPSAPVDTQEQKTPTNRATGLQATIARIKALSPRRKLSSVQRTKRTADSISERSRSPTVKRRARPTVEMPGENLIIPPEMHSIPAPSVYSDPASDDEDMHMPLEAEESLFENPFADQDDVNLIRTLEATLNDLEVIANRLPDGYVISRDRQHALLGVFNRLTECSLTSAVLEVEQLSNTITHSMNDVHQAVKTLQDQMNKMATSIDQRFQKLEGTATEKRQPTTLQDSIHNPRNQNPNTPNKATKTKQDNKPDSEPTNNSPTSRHHPSRLVIQILPDGMPEQERQDPPHMVKQINETLMRFEDSQQMRIVSAKWNANGNCVVFTRADQKAEDLIKFQDRFVRIIAQGRQAVARVDKKWVKIQVNGVRTGTFDMTPTLYTPETIHEELSANNPAYAALNIIAMPRWMRTQDELRTQNYSSVVFATDDEEKANKLLREVKSLAVFGRYAFLRRYADRPPVVQCKRCWSYEHTTTTCKAKSPRCGLCGENHTEAEHGNECKECEAEAEMETDNPKPCMHNLRCLHCKEGEHAKHAAYARRCPERVRRIGTARTNESAQPTHETDGWINVRKKKPTNKQRTTNKTANTNNNRFGMLPEDVEGPSIDRIMRNDPTNSFTHEQVDEAMQHFTTTPHDPNPIGWE